MKKEQHWGRIDKKMKALKKTDDIDEFNQLRHDIEEYLRALLKEMKEETLQSQT